MARKLRPFERPVKAGRSPRSEAAPNATSSGMIKRSVPFKRSHRKRPDSLLAEKLSGELEEWRSRKASAQESCTETHAGIVAKEATSSLDIWTQYGVAKQDVSPLVFTEDYIPLDVSAGSALESPPKVPEQDAVVEVQGVISAARLSPKGSMQDLTGGLQAMCVSSPEPNAADIQTELEVTKRENRILWQRLESFMLYGTSPVPGSGEPPIPEDEPIFSDSLEALRYFKQEVSVLQQELQVYENGPNVTEQSPAATLPRSSHPGDFKRPAIPASRSSEVPQAGPIGLPSQDLTMTSRTLAPLPIHYPRVPPPEIPQSHIPLPEWSHGVRPDSGTGL